MPEEAEMAVALGVDTGGTYTDGVVVDRKTGRVLAKSKVPTDKTDLLSSILAAVDSLGEQAQRAQAVILSTTLATNAVVEGQGARVGLLAIGGEIDWTTPAGELRLVAGGHTIDGEPASELDVRGAEEAARSFGERVEAVAISGYLSVRNPEHELVARDIVRRVTGLPVVCAHELTTALGYRERTDTAVLNARLMPIIRNLVGAARSALEQRRIRKPVFFLRSDGSLMAGDRAWHTPIQLVLSGPAASISGGVFLSGMAEAIVIDMGGTTSDIAIVGNGRARLNEEGALVGGWRTRVVAPDVTTVGLGGDSHVWRDRHGELRIGPRRVMPLAVFAQNWTDALTELRSLEDDPTYQPLRSEPHDFVFLAGRKCECRGQAGAVAAALADHPLSVRGLSRALGIHPDLLPLDQLERNGIICRSGLTPTDILHATGRLGLGEAAASRFGVAIMSRRLRCSEQELARRVLDQITDRLCRELMFKVLSTEGPLAGRNPCPGCEAIVDQAVGCRQRSPVGGLSAAVRLPLVGVGAPAAAYLPAVAERLGTTLVIPHHGDAASAVGAVVGNVAETVRLKIRKSPRGYVLFSPWERGVFPTLEEAKERARALAAEKFGARRGGARMPEVMVTASDVTLPMGGGEVYLGTELTVVATGSLPDMTTMGAYQAGTEGR